jgi:phosphoribosylaminoimidazole-succinocarboxamide synthase
MPDAVHLGSGKVRELYALDDERLLLVASDRISTFDVVLPTAIPDKGRVLTGMSAFWFARTADICANHLLALRPDGRSTECRRLEMLPIECVVRGYLVGSGWKDYRATGTVCGHSLPPGMVEAQKLPKPLFTPSTKATDGHDQNIDRDAGVLLVGEERFNRLEQVAIELYETAAEYALISQSAPPAFDAVSRGREEARGRRHHARDVGEPAVEPRRRAGRSASGK